MPKKTAPLRRVAMLTCGLAVSAPAAAAAHFVLEEPENWREQSVLGDPQKTGPCGNEAPDRPTGAVTAYRTGQTITVRFRESVFHPGHFRVALSTADRSELPEPPPVTVGGGSDCGSVPIMDPPVFPVLADGILPHTSPLTGEQSFDVTLPDGVTCDHCTLQIVQFMSSHGAPCFYYHCADLMISDVIVDSGVGADDAGMTPAADAAIASVDSGATMDSGSTPGVDAGPMTAPSGCACSARRAAPSPRGTALLALIAFGTLAARRRR